MQGEYLYTLNGQPVDVTETFVVTENRIRSERAGFGSLLAVDAELEAGILTWFEVRYGEVVSARYAIHAWGVEVEKVRAGTSSVERKQVAGRFVVFPLMRIFMGGVIHQLEAAGGQDIPVIVPWIFDPKNEAQLLSPHVDRRSARRLDDGLYQYLGENYDESARFWVDARGVLARYTWQQGENFWDVRLRETTADD